MGCHSNRQTHDAQLSSTPSCLLFAVSQLIHCLVILTYLAQRDRDDLIAQLLLYFLSLGRRDKRRQARESNDEIDDIS